MMGERLLIKDALVADPASGAAEPRDLLIENGRIGCVAPPATIEGAGIDVHHAPNRLILPGLVNAHTHGHANLVKGVADRWTLEASLTNGPWLSGARDPETIYLSTLVGALDMVSGGCTSAFDLVYEFPLPTLAGFRAAAEACADAGMKAVLAPMVADRTLFAAIPGLLDALPADLRSALTSFDLGSGDATLAAIEEIIAARDSLPDGIEIAIAPTIPHHCSEEFLSRCLRLAERHGLLVHMHLAESRLQAVAAQKLWGMSPVRYLDRQGALGPDFIAAHGVWLDEADLDLLAERGSSIAHIPASNFRLGSGMAHVRQMLERGINVGLATDGANSSDALSMLQAMRLASYGSRLFAGSRDDWLSAAETLRLATMGGADLLGLDHAGRIEPDAVADLVFFDLGHIDFIPLNDPVNQLVTAAGSAAVTDVMTDGEFIVRDGKHTRIDTSDLQARATEAAERQLKTLAEGRAFAARLEPHVVAFAEKMAGEPLAIERFIHPQGGKGL